VPAGQLGARFPGRLTGTIGQAGLNGPDGGGLPRHARRRAGRGGGRRAGVAAPGAGLAARGHPTAGALTDILVGRVELPAAPGQRLIGGIRAIPGAAVFPLYDLLSPGYEALGPTLVAVSCADLCAIGALGQCAPGVRAVQVPDNQLFDDSPRFSDKPIAGSSSPAYAGRLTALPVQTVLVRVNSPATLERVRTYLAVHAPPQVSLDNGDSPAPPSR
jgi:hypothetical protein